MPTLMVDLITSLDGNASARGWPGWWGLEGPEYLGWLQEDQPDDGYLTLMGATTYRLMSQMSTDAAGEGGGDFRTEEADSLSGLDAMQKVVFSSTLTEPLAWPVPLPLMPRALSGRFTRLSESPTVFDVPSVMSAML